MVDDSPPFSFVHTETFRAASLSSRCCFRQAGEKLGRDGCKADRSRVPRICNGIVAVGIDVEALERGG